MLKYVDTAVVFQEIPDETTLAVNLSRCPCHCPGCHSRHLWDDIGEPLTEEVIDGWMATYGGEITCLCLMGGDAEPAAVDGLAAYVRRRYPSYRVAWYTGRTRISREIDRSHFDYIKVGPYIAHLGPLKSRTTNQRLYRLTAEGTEDITARFWR